MNKELNDYNQYIFQNGEFSGKFEEMYQNIENPWDMNNSHNLKYEAILFLLNYCYLQPERILDLGCGKGIFTSRLRELYPEAVIEGADISKTAIKMAKSLNSHANISWKVLDLNKEYDQIPLNYYDLIIVSDVLWYIIPNLKKIILQLEKSLGNEGYILIAQSFYPSGKQKYATDSFTKPEELINYFSLDLIKSIETGSKSRIDDYHTALLFKR